MKFFNKKVYIVPGNGRRFRTELEAVLYCNNNGLDTATIEKYDSIKEYERWLELQRMQSKGLITGLQRQVEFEIIPAHVETVHVRDKAVNVWLAGFVINGSQLKGVSFRTRKEAEAYCRENNISLTCITKNTITEPVLKEVVVEQNAVYTADFVYVEDCKSEYTRKEKDYILRRKLMLHVHGIHIVET